MVNAAPRGLAALKQASERAPEGSLVGLRRGAAQIDARLAGNLDNLRHALSVREGSTLLGNQALQTQFEQTTSALTTQAATEFGASADGFVNAFGRLGGHGRRGRRELGAAAGAAHGQVHRRQAR